eukprot:GFKZ01008455.1.p1 GENE.GFKZ01008455.1~~GFKZ01008455.1.p1  ORF type:complete len:105 (+),score=0.88 GFKZ01008455.1:1360-1674(+)
MWSPLFPSAALELGVKPLASCSSRMREIRAPSESPVENIVLKPHSVVPLHESLNRSTQYLSAFLLLRHRPLPASPPMTTPLLSITAHFFHHSWPTSLHRSFSPL